jgi:hypothetical protein
MLTCSLRPRAGLPRSDRSCELNVDICQCLLTFDELDVCVQGLSRPFEGRLQLRFRLVDGLAVRDERQLRRVCPRLRMQPIAYLRKQLQ